jgi:hypothetical protein
MKKFFKTLFRFTMYCIVYVALVNATASYLNGTLGDTNLKEIISIPAMRSGQNDILVKLRHEIENVDIESIQENIVQELKDLEQNSK